MQGEHLDRPRADAGDRAQPRPAALVVGRAQVGAPGGDLARGPAQRQRAARGEVERLQARRGRRPASVARRRQVAQPGARAASGPCVQHDPPLDRRGALELDQLLADRPRQRLERVGAPAHAQVAAGRGPSARSAGRRGSGRRTGAGRRRRRARSASARWPPRRRRRARPRRRTRRAPPTAGPRGPRRARPRRAAAACSTEPTRRCTPSIPPPGEPQGPDRTHLSPHLDHRRATLRERAATGRRGEARERQARVGERVQRQQRAEHDHDVADAEDVAHGPARGHGEHVAEEGEVRMGDSASSSRTRRPSGRRPRWRARRGRRASRRRWRRSTSRLRPPPSAASHR